MANQLQQDIQRRDTQPRPSGASHRSRKCRRWRGLDDLFQERLRDAPHTDIAVGVAPTLVELLLLPLAPETHLLGDYIEASFTLRAFYRQLGRPVGLELPILALIPGLGTLRRAWRVTYADSRMKDLLLDLLHLAVMTARLCGPGGVRAVIAGIPNADEWSQHRWQVRRHPPARRPETEHPPNAPVSILVTMTTARSLAARHKKRGARSRAVPPWKKSGNTDRWTEILFRALTARVAKRWRFVSFRGTGGGEWRGVVDVLAIRKDTSRSNHRVFKSGDLFEMVLVQMKGGSAGSPKPQTFTD